MVVFSLTSSQYCNIVEKSLKLNTFTTQQQTFTEAKRIYCCTVFTMVHQTSNSLFRQLWTILRS